MRLGGTLKQSKTYQVPARNLFDVVGTNDLSSLLTVVRGVNPFDVSPGIELILRRMDMRPSTANPYVSYTDELDFDKDSIATARDCSGNSALHVAAMNGYTQVATVLIQECQCLVDDYNAAGMTPLHLAARNGHLECVQLLCSAGVNPLTLTTPPPVLTRSEPGAGRIADHFLSSRTSLFLAHWHQHHSVSMFLSSYFTGAEPVHSHSASYHSKCSSFTGATVDAHDLVTATLRLDTLVFAQLFDVLDSESSVCGCLNIPWVQEMVPTLGEAIPRVLHFLLPLQAAMMPEQLWIFESLVIRGYATPESLTDDANGEEIEGQPATVLQCVLNRAQSGALRVLVAHGLDVWHCHPRLSTRLPAENVASAQDNACLLLLLQEAEARTDFDTAMEALRRGGKRSKKLREAAMEEKVKLRHLQRQLASQGLAPL